MECSERKALLGYRPASKWQISVIWATLEEEEGSLEVSFLLWTSSVVLGKWSVLAAFPGCCLESSRKCHLQDAAWAGYHVTVSVSSSTVLSGAVLFPHIGCGQGRSD